MTSALRRLFPLVLNSKVYLEGEPPTSPPPSVTLTGKNKAEYYNYLSKSIKALLQLMYVIRQVTNQQ